jgi:DNA polymerase elongation subunit (family B)
MNSTPTMSATHRDLIFHLLDIQARDMRIESEEEDVRELAFESNSDASDDEEFQNRRRRRKTVMNQFSKRREFIIHLFGATESGQPVRCDVTGFRPTLYLRLPEDKTSQAAESIKSYLNAQGIPMGEVTIQRVMKKIFYGFTANTFFPFLQLDVPSLNLFRTIKNLFLDEDCKPCTKRPLDGCMRGKTVEVFEANIDPMLRFLHTQNIQPCGWVSIRDGLRLGQQEEGGWVLECDYSEVMPTKGPRVSAPFLTASWDIECFSMTGDFPLAKRTWKKAAKDVLTLANNAAHAAELVVASLSVGQNPVETLPKGMTPIYCQLKRPLEDVNRKLLEADNHAELKAVLASKEDWDDRVTTLELLLNRVLKQLVALVGDPVIQIGTTLTRGTPESVEQHLFVFPDCAPIDGITVHAYKTEKAMILGWFEWMVERNPDILIGYNVFGFDESYLWYRAEELGITGSNSPIHQFTRLFSLSSEMKLEEKRLSSSAMGDNFMYIWTTHGRLQVDLYHYIKRNSVLPSYKLDEVTKHFMSGKLKKQSYDRENGILLLEVAGAVKEVRAGRAITLLDDTGETVTPKMVVESVEGNVLTIRHELDEDALMEMEDATKWVIVKDDVSPQDIFRLHRESAEGRAVVGKYCLQDCGLVIDLYKKLETFNNSMSMANVCSVPVSYIFTRGQGIKIESLIFKQCRERNILIPVLYTPKNSADDSYEGAIVLDPQPGFYSNSPIGVCDFASLYPSTIVSENISHDSLLWVKDFKDDGSLIAHNWGSDVYADCEGYAFTDIEYDIWRPDPADTRKHPRKIKCGRRICRYAQPLDGTKSTLPQITTWLLSAREAKKKEMKAEKDAERYALLDAEQLAYKLTGNSLYGQLGSSTFKIRLQALAASVTAYGRKQILFAKAAIEKFYGPEANDPRVSVRCMAKVVYGDSVTGDTPILIRIDGSKITYYPIQDLVDWSRAGVWHDDKEMVVPKFIETWTERGWTPIKKVIRHKLHPEKKLYRITTQSGYVDVTEDHSLVLQDTTEVKPTEIRIGQTKLLHSLPISGIISPMEYTMTRPSCYLRNDQNILKCHEAFKWYNDYVNESRNIFERDFSNKSTIIKMEILPHPGEAYVYDLETENHHFAVGPGALIVHNTDSLFVEFNVKNPETGERLQGREARQATIDITDEAGHFITKCLKAPHDFEFDKAFDPLLMFSKKRYAGNMYENNADDYVHKYMGIALKRRDNAPIVKTIFGGAMKMLLNARDVAGAFQFVKDKCLELVDGKVSLGQLTISKSLRADYADPSRIAHKALADRIAARDPGNAPAAGDRIAYVYISPKAGQEASKLQGDRIETPLYIREHGLRPDYRHYIEHQLQNPISQAFGLLLEQIPGFKPEMVRSCPSAADDLDKYLAVREAKAAELLFSDCLKKLETASRRSAVMNMFGGRATMVASSAASAKTSKRVQEESGPVNAVVYPSNTTAAPVTAATTSKRGPVQTSISNFLADSFIIDSMKKKAKSKAAAEKAAVTKAAKKASEGLK